MIEVLFFVSGLVTVVHVANVAFTINQYRHRHRFHVIQLADFLARIEQHRKVHAQLFDHLHCAPRVIIDIHAEQIKTHTLITAVELVQQRHLLPTRTAPGRPEVDHDYVAPGLRQAQVLPGRALQGKIGR